MKKKNKLIRKTLISFYVQNYTFEHKKIKPKEKNMFKTTVMNIKKI